jgi:hypothetical protein
MVGRQNCTRTGSRAGKSFFRGGGWGGVLGTTAETAEIAETVLDGPESQGVEVGILPDVKVRRRPRRAGANTGALLPVAVRRRHKLVKDLVPLAGHVREPAPDNGPGEVLEVPDDSMPVGATRRTVLPLEGCGFQPRVEHGHQAVDLCKIPAPREPIHFHQQGAKFLLYRWGQAALLEHDFKVGNLAEPPGLEGDLFLT